MLYISVDDFFEKTSLLKAITRQEELLYASAMLSSDSFAKEMIFNGYLPYIVSKLKQLPIEHVTLQLIYRYLHALDRAIDSFDFMQNSETFSHRLNWYLKEVTTQYLIDYWR